MSASKGLREPILSRSKVLINIPVLHDKELNEGINFLAYKKGKREISSRQKGK
jgi:hypothetical protein